MTIIELAKHSYEVDPRPQPARPCTRLGDGLPCLLHEVGEKAVRAYQAFIKLHGSSLSTTRNLVLPQDYARTQLLYRRLHPLPAGLTARLKLDCFLTLS
jgi:hypothetical protein